MKVDSNSRFLKLSIDNNALDFLEKYSTFDFYSSSFTDLKFAFISVVSFFELVLKWYFSIDNKEEIWKKSKTTKSTAFNERDYNTGQFYSIGIDVCLNKAITKRIITKSNKKVIEKLNSIRNTIIHFEVAGKSKLINSNCLKISKTFIKKVDSAISSLLKKIERRFSKELRISYNSLINHYLNIL